MEEEFMYEDSSDELARMAQETIEEQMNAPDVANMRTRCQRVIDLYAKGMIEDGRDHFHAGLVLLHGERTAHYELARTFSRRASDMGEARAWTVQAMAWDRWLLSLGKPQRFGTQIIKQQGRWSLGDVDVRITDSLRAFYGVPPLFVQEQRVRQLQRQEDSGD